MLDMLVTRNPTGYGATLWLYRDVVLTCRKANEMGLKNEKEAVEDHVE